MKVRMKQQLTGSRNGLRWPAPGGVIDVLDVEAADLLASGIAEPVKAEKPADKAEKRPASRKRVETREG